MTLAETAPYLQGLHAAVDEADAVDKPNFPALGLLADELDRLGLPDHAECYRWCMTAGRWPDRWFDGSVQAGPRRFTWWNIAKDIPERSRLTALDNFIVRVGIAVFADSAAQAFAELAEAWAEHREKGRNPFDAAPGFKG